MRLSKIPPILLMLLIPTTLNAVSFHADPFMQYGLEPAACIVTDHSGATFYSAYEILLREGARALHAFPPAVIFGRFPPQLKASDFEGLPVRIVRTPSEALRTELDHITYRVILNLLDQESTLMSCDPAGETEFEEMVLEPPMEGSLRSAGQRRKSGSPAEISERNIWQNSEILIGTVLINMLFPESYGDSENWTTDEISEAITGIAIGLSELQQHTHWVELNFYYNYKDFIMVPVNVEPIETYWTEHHLWIADLMRYLGYVSDDTTNAGSGAVHKFNNETREEFGTDWVFTVIIADQSNHYNPDPPYPDPGCWGGSGVITYTFYGGPYIVMSYPACKLGHGLGFSRVFVHEMCHVFWAMDEYYSGGQNCNARSGYCDVPNKNTLYMQCQDVELCIMMGVSYGQTLPACRYTMKQMGLGDDNDNSIPDVYETKPEIQLIDAPGINADTIYHDKYVLGARIISPAIPNKNPMQLTLRPDEMIDYAPRLAKGSYWINNQFDMRIGPSDGKWDESREDIGYLISGFDSGLNTLTLNVENYVGVTSQLEKKVFLVGIKYYAATARSTEECVELKWITGKETFDAEFEIVKQDLTLGSDPVVLDTVDTPREIGLQKKCYVFEDKEIIPAHRYRYLITGNFDLDVAGELRHFKFRAPELLEIAMIPLGSDFVSYVLPNPAREHVDFTVDVPKSYFDPSDPEVGSGANLHSPADILEEKTPLDIRIFNVSGQLIKTLYSRDSLGGIKTLRWDCIDNQGRSVSPGVYFIRVSAGEKRAVRKVVVLR